MKSMSKLKKSSKPSKSFRKGSMVVIYWTDALLSDPLWKSWDEVNVGEHVARSLVRSMGTVVAQEHGQLVIAQNYRHGAGANHVNCLLTVPEGWIVDSLEIKEK